MNIERIKAVGFGYIKPDSGFQRINFTRRPVGPKDIQIEILYAGICHSDIHTVLNHWDKVEKYPLIPGHEIFGKCTAIGDQVTNFSVGDLVGIGCMVDSCKECQSCKNGREQDCCKTVLTYASFDWRHDNEYTQGGYSNTIVVSEDFAIKFPKEVKQEKAAPLLCAGITTYSPIKQANVSERDIVGVIGLGGLGTMAVKYMKELGCKVIAFDTSDKEKYADKLGIGFVCMKDGIDESLYRKFDFMISTVPYKYDINDYLPLMKYNGSFAIVGLPPYDECPSISIKDMILKYPGVKIFGSQIGGIQETQECVNFSVAKNIYPEAEIIEPNTESLDKAYKSLLNGNVEGRFVIDMRHMSQDE